MTTIVKRVSVAGALAALALAASGCWQPPAEPAPVAAGPVTAADHAGWQAHDCAACHDLPAPGHEPYEAWECAACHGGNGACIPGGFGEHTDREHDPRAACTVCHESMHGITERDACAACHFAPAGTVPCADDAGG